MLREALSGGKITTSASDQSGTKHLAAPLSLLLAIREISGGQGTENCNT